jgi:hypothetical protein
LEYTGPRRNQAFWTGEACLRTFVGKAVFPAYRQNFILFLFCFWRQGVYVAHAGSDLLGSVNLPNSDSQVQLEFESSLPATTFCSSWRAGHSLQ